MSCFLIPVSALTVESIQHETGRVEMRIDGSGPFKIYRSLNNVDFTLIDTVTGNVFSECGLEGGKTYIYKVVDSFGGNYIVRYSVPILIKQQLPLSIVDVSDTMVTVEWDMYDFQNADIYLNGSKIEHFDYINSYTFDNLQPNTLYKVYIKNKFGVKSNTISFKTTAYLDSIDKMLKELLLSNGLNRDSDSDGISDAIEPIHKKLSDIADKLGGKLISDVKTVIENVDYSTGIDDLKNLPKIETEFMGLKIKVFDLDDKRFLPMMKTIRKLVLCVLTVVFIFFVISFFSVVFKV